MSYLDLFSAVNPLVEEKNTKAPVLTVFGVPFDGTSSYRPGSRFGPNAIREAFLNVEAYSKRLDVDVEKLPIRDVGNLAKVNDPGQMIGAVSKAARDLYDSKARFCMLGGEHSLTFGSYSNAPEGTALVVFDAHFDLRDEWEGSRFSHACYLRRVIEKVEPALVAHIGGRAATKEEWSLSSKLGFVVSPAEAGTTTSVREFGKFRSKFPRIYVSVDIDALDPAHAPGTGTPETGGLTPNELLEYIYALKGSNIVAFDIMEVSPPYDQGITAVVAARFMNEMAALVASVRK